MRISGIMCEEDRGGGGIHTQKGFLAANVSCSLCGGGVLLLWLLMVLLLLLLLLVLM